MKRAEGTIRQKLFAIKFAHPLAGLPDPLLRRVRLWAALAGIKRWRGAPLRRHPIMPEQLEWLYDHLFDEYDRRFFDAAIRASVQPDALGFRMSARMTSAGGKTVRFVTQGHPEQTRYEISVSTTLLY